MLTFDATLSIFQLDGTPIGPRVDGRTLVEAFGVAARPMPGDERWRFVQSADRPIDFFATLLNGVVHSGYFWVGVPSGGWDDYERAEQQRRAEHERIMQRLFGRLSFEDHRVRVELLRDPRSGLEQIAFDSVLSSSDVTR